MEKVAVVIIGAGVVGLAIAERLSRTGARRDIIVLERHDAPGRETSSRNSEVIHAGFYYPCRSLKAFLCVSGNRLMYDFCRDHAVPHRRIGKLVVARNADDEGKIHELFEKGRENGVEGLSLCGSEEIKTLEPAITGRSALYSRDTGILDTHSFLKKLEQLSIGRGVTVAYNCDVRGIGRITGGYEVMVADADGSMVSLASECVINAAGLSADAVAALAGIDVDKAGYRIHYCKGEYFGVSGRHRGRLSHLVYPAPTPISLGIHGVLGLDGAIKLGPSAFFIETVDYTVDSGHRSSFYESAKTLFPFLEEGDLSPDMAGIRPKLQRSGFHDFVLRDEADNGLPGLINCVGIESPGLTSALAIGDYVETLVR